MAFSIYATFQKSILTAGHPYWDAYIEKSPWAIQDNDVFTWVKPRLEEGTERLRPFLAAVSEAQGHLVKLSADDCLSPSPAIVRAIIKDLGHPDLASSIKFGQSSDAT